MNNNDGCNTDDLPDFHQQIRVATKVKFGLNWVLRKTEVNPMIVVVLLIFGLCIAPVKAQERSSQAGSKAVQLDRNILNGFVKQHCIRCHGPSEQEGDLRLDQLSDSLSSNVVAGRWQEVLDALNLGDMPPKGEPSPTDQELEPVLEHLTNSLLEARKRLAETGGDVFLRRINRREYRNTIEDLFGFTIPVDLIPEDDIANGYDTVGQDQLFSAYHFNDYFTAAETIVRSGLFWSDRPRVESSVKVTEGEEYNERLDKYVRTYDKKMARIAAGDSLDKLGFDDEKQKELYINRYDPRAGVRKNYLEKTHADKGMFLEENVFRALEASFNYEALDPRGEYQFRVVAGLTPGNHPDFRKFMEIKDANGPIVSLLKIDGTIESPGTRELIIRPKMDQKRLNLKVTENRVRSLKIEEYVKQVNPRGSNSVIWLDRMELEGPFYKDVPFFETLYDKFVGKGKFKSDNTDKRNSKKKKRKTKKSKTNTQQVVPLAENTADRKLEDQNAKQFIQTFATKAFRNRVPSSEYLDKLYQIYFERREQNQSMTEALVTPLAMVISSPSFLYLMEEQPAEKSKSVSQAEFANRLSYFLWSRLPDAELLNIVAEGKLYDPVVLKSQVKRMLDHPNRWALSEGFISQWAELARFDDIGIDQTKHVSFNDGIRHSARLEVQHFFDTLIAENLAVDQLIDSDFVVVNRLLAQHYGLNHELADDEFQKVNLPADSPRGGLVGQTAFLTMGSNGERSSPIIRGVLITEKFLNQEVASPPANVPELATASEKPLPVMESVKLHREKAQCASCHAKLDPIGFGLENFDLLGQWRDNETVGNIGKKKGAKKSSVPVRAEGTFPNGMKFRNIEQFKSALLNQKELVARSITEGMLSYALGRHLEFSDDQAIDEICQTSKQNNDRVGDLVYAIVSHPIFRRSDRSKN